MGGHQRIGPAVRFPAESSVEPAIPPIIPDVDAELILRLAAMGASTIAGAELVTFLTTPTWVLLKDAWI